jgi:hypothetical protein
MYSKYSFGTDGWLIDIFKKDFGEWGTQGTSRYPALIRAAPSLEDEWQLPPSATLGTLEDTGDNIKVRIENIEMVLDYSQAAILCGLLLTRHQDMELTELDWEPEEDIRSLYE